MGKNAQKKRKRKGVNLHIDEIQMSKSKLMVFRMKDGSHPIISDRPFMDGMNLIRWDNPEGRDIVERLLSNVTELELTQNIKEPAIMKEARA